MIFSSTQSQGKMRGRDGKFYEFPRRAHEANPILVAIRDLYPNGMSARLAGDAARYLTGGLYAMGVPITPEHSKHAKRVLERLARIKESE